MSKIQELSQATPSSRPRDPVIGLDLSGQRVYYCRKSTLTNAGSLSPHPNNYFAARFSEDSMLDPEAPESEEANAILEVLGSTSDILL